MKYGVFIFATDRSMHIGSLAKAAEERGFESLWVPEHAHIPVDRQTPYPMAKDGKLPEMYTRIYDPFVALGVAAGATAELKLGTGICLVSQRDPILLAKEIATLDRLSGGRFLFGIGAGWLREEMEALGTKYETRWKVTEERVAAMKRAWTDDEVEFSGEFVNVPPTMIYPKPVQRPHPPIYIGAASRWARQRVVDWADGWLPNRSDPAFVERGIADLRSRAEKAGRDPASIGTTVFGAPPDALDSYARMGVERCIFMLPSAPQEEVLPELDRFAKLLVA
jgi:probable F420-dependent oxidoreductase